MGTHLLVSSVISGLEMPPALCILLFFKSLGQQYAFLPNRSSGQCLDQSIFGMRLGHSWNSSVYFFLAKEELQIWIVISWTSVPTTALLHYVFVELQLLSWNSFLKVAMPWVSFEKWCQIRSFWVLTFSTLLVWDLQVENRYQTFSLIKTILLSSRHFSRVLGTLVSFLVEYRDRNYS